MTKFRITAPVVDFTGVSAGVNFTKGVAEIDAPVDDPQHEDARRVSYFQSAGYGVEELDEQPTGELPDEAAEDNLPPAPAKSASKADWVAYVVEHHKVDPADADKLTRDQLAAQYGPKGEDQ